MKVNFNRLNVQCNIVFYMVHLRRIFFHPVALNTFLYKGGNFQEFKNVFLDVGRHKRILVKMITLGKNKEIHLR